MVDILGRYFCGSVPSANLPVLTLAGKRLHRVNQLQALALRKVYDERRDLREEQIRDDVFFIACRSHGPVCEKSLDRDIEGVGEIDQIRDDQFLLSALDHRDP